VIDRYDLPVTAASAAALGAYDLAVHGLLGWDARALALFRAATDADPALALAHAGTGVCLFLEERFDEARAAVETARAAAAGQTPRERGHVEALGLLVSGKSGDAERLMREHLQAYPRDLMVLERLYFMWFWQGRFPEMLELTSRLCRHYGGESFMPGLHAFALEEAGRCDEAVRVAAGALRRNERDAWAVHAFAHAVYEMAAFETGLLRLPAAIHPCGHLGWFRDHLLWHLALMHLSRGDYDRALRLSQTVFERAPSSIPGNLHDSISLLWRLALCGIDVSDRWKPFTDIARERLARPALWFHVAHLAMALAGGGDWATAARQVTLLRERAPKDKSGLVGGVVLPLVEGVQAFGRGDYRRAADLIEPVRHRLIELGGSRAQRDVFADTLLEACLRAGDVDRAARLLAERVARRPDHQWLQRKAGATASVWAHGRRHRTTGLGRRIALPGDLRC
jgi:tetratricopeptide (TPR) repeat protein